MSPSRFERARHEAVALVLPSPPAVGFRMTLQYGVVAAIAILVSCLVFGPALGAISLFGSMVTQWQNGRPFSLRLRTMLCAAAATTATMSVGVLGANLGLFVTPMIVAVILAVAVVYYTFVLLQGPGPLNLFYGVALGSYLGAVPSVGWHVVGVTAFSSAVTIVLGCLTLLPDRRGPEKNAVQGARTAVEAFERASSNDLVADPDVVRASRDAAYAAVNRGWIVLQSARRRGHARPLDSAMLSLNRRLAVAIAASLRWPTPPDEVPTSLLRGRPKISFLARHGFRLYSIPWFTAWRIGLAAGVSGGLTSALGFGHPYWAILTATIIVVQWSSRIALTRRAVQRSLGTLLGIGVFAGVVSLGLSTWTLVGVLIVCMMGMNVLVLRNYVLGNALITPMALLSVELSGQATALRTLVGDRLLETLVGAAVAVLVTWLTGLRMPKRIVLKQFRRTVAGIEGVLRLLAEHGGFGPDTLRLRSELQYELLVNESAVSRAAADDPSLAEWRNAERLLGDLGYTTLAACWLPDPRADAETRDAAYALDQALSATRALDPATADPLDEPERAAALLTTTRAILIRERT